MKYVLKLFSKGVGRMTNHIQRALTKLAIDTTSTKLMISYSVPGIDAFELSPNVLALVEEDTATLLGTVESYNNKQGMEITAAMIPGVNIVRSKLNVISSNRNLRTKGTQKNSAISLKSGLVYRTMAMFKRNYGMSLHLLLGVLLLSTLTITNLTFAAEPVSESHGVAIGGHDTVAYHKLSRNPHANAAKGDSTWVVEYLGAEWRFASKESADLFAENPSKYQPAYNGHCANALSLGNGLVVTDGKVWEIFGDQLYLFFAERGRKRWITADDISEYKAAADTAWKTLSIN